MVNVEIDYDNQQIQDLMKALTLKSDHQFVYNKSRDIQLMLEHIQKMQEVIGQSFIPSMFRIIQTTRYHQTRKHRRPRINKKWRKRFGVTSCEIQTEDIVLIGNEIYVTERGLEQIKASLNQK